MECEGAYIEVERENNGFEARWCGNRVTTGGSRPHVIFAKNQVRITVFDDGSQNKDLPTGFSADIEGKILLRHHGGPKNRPPICPKKLMV